MDPLILTTPQQLQLLVEKAMRNVLEEKQFIAATKSREGPITIKEASAYLNLTVSTLYRYTSQRLITFHKPGKNIVFYKEDLDRWLVSHKKYTKAEIEAGADIFKNAKGKRKL
jgi:excisionase family DNA binding protein